MGNVTDRVEEVLRDAGKSLHYQEITEQMIERGWQTKGLTPWSTVNAHIVTEMKKGESSKFVRTGRGIYGINPDFTDKTDPLTPNQPPQPAPPRPSHEKEKLFLEERVALLEECCDRLRSELKELRDYLDSEDKWRKALKSLLTELEKEP